MQRVFCLEPLVIYGCICLQSCALCTWKIYTKHKLLKDEEDTVQKLRDLLDWKLKKVH